MEYTDRLTKFEIVKQLPAASVVSLCQTNKDWNNFCLNNKVYSFIWNRDYPEWSNVIKRLRETNVKINLLTRLQKEVVFFLTVDGDYVGDCLYSYPHEHSVKIIFPTNIADKKYTDNLRDLRDNNQLTFSDIANKKKIGIIGEYYIRDGNIKNFTYRISLMGNVIDKINQYQTDRGTRVVFTKIVKFCHSVPISEDTVKLDECNNEIDYITQDDWSEYNRDEVIMIKFGLGNERWSCYDKDMLSIWINQPNNTMANWVPQNENGIMDDVGRGGVPGQKRFVKMPDGWWVSKHSIRSALQSGMNKLILADVGRSRIGNLRGVFGVSNLHGQLPAVTIYGLTEHNSRM